MWWVNIGWLPGVHQAALSFRLLSRTGGENETKKLVGQDKDREITHQLPAQAKQTELGEIILIYYQLNRAG